MHVLELIITRYAIQYVMFITKLFMKLVKGCKECHEGLLKNAPPSSEPSIMLLLELIKPA